MMRYRLRAYIWPHGVTRYDSDLAMTLQEIFRGGPPSSRYAVAFDESNRVVVIDLFRIVFRWTVDREGHQEGVPSSALNYDYRDLDQAVMGTALNYQQTTHLVSYGDLNVTVYNVYPYKPLKLSRHCVTNLNRKEAFDYSYQDIDQAIMATALTYTHSSLLDRRERWQAKSLRHAEMYSTDQPINLKRWLSQIRDH